jgi:hypothetical protein
MLNNDSIEYIFDYPVANEVFSNVEIKGGVCFFLQNANYHGQCKYSYTAFGKTDTVVRTLNEFDVFVRNPMVIRITRKVYNPHIEVLSTLISGDTPFGIPTNPKTSKKTPVSVHDAPENGTDTLLYYLEEREHKTGYIERAGITKNAGDIDLYKAIFPFAGGSGTDDIILGKPVVIPPNSVCSQTYLYVPFENELEAHNYSKYYKTKLLRLLVSAVKVTQHAPAKAYRFVPIQDFTKNSDILWDATVQEIDRQLYEKYGLDDNEVFFIENNIRTLG